MVLCLGINVVWLRFRVAKRGQCPNQVFAGRENFQANRSIFARRQSLMNGTYAS
jgi:hypothetical protein